VCPYHSWTYGLDGALRARPHGEDFPDGPAQDCALARVPAAEALGLVWAIPRVVEEGEDPQLDLTAWLGRFGADLRHWGYDGWAALHQREFAKAFTVLPEAVDQSRVLATTLVPEMPKTEKSIHYWKKNVESFWGALDEDFALGVSAQSTVASGANRVRHFGATEWCAAKFHEDVEGLIR
jgi:hypothetical protein